MATNKEIIEKVLPDMPKEYAEKIEGKSGEELQKVMEDYPNVKNAFITTLTNKVAKSLLYSKIYQNQLKELKKGTLTVGDSIEELFVQMAQVKGFTSHWDDNGQSAEADLIRKLTPKVSAMYIQTNVDYKGKATITEKVMRKAFISEEGLQNLVAQIVGSIQSAMEFKEFELTKLTLKKLVEEGKSVNWLQGDTPSDVDINTSATNSPINQTPYCVECDSILSLSKNIRETVGLMKFPSTKFNLAKELTWSQPEELILVTTPGVIADLDVNLLASAFNVSMADLNTRTVLVDEMPQAVFKGGNTAIVDKVPGTCDHNGNKPTKDETLKPQAILMSKDLLQIWDTFQGTGSFHNPDQQYTNYFGNREGIFATCLFANMAVFYKK